MKRMRLARTQTVGDNLVFLRMSESRAPNHGRLTTGT